MKIDSGECQFREGAWECHFQSSSKRMLEVWLLGDRTFFDLSDVMEPLRVFLSQADKIIDDAVQYAIQSVYRSDIEECDGMRFVSILVQNWANIRVWFRLNCQEDRMLAVAIVSGIPDDVYCEAPMKYDH